MSTTTIISEPLGIYSVLAPAPAPAPAPATLLESDSEFILTNIAATTTPVLITTPIVNTTTPTIKTTNTTINPVLFYFIIIGVVLLICISCSSILPSNKSPVYISSPPMMPMYYRM